MKLISILRKTRKKYNSKKFNWFVKKYYKKNKSRNIEYLKNIWNTNKYWDFYYQSFNHCIKSLNYVPYDYYNYKILPNLNDPTTKVYVQDKNIFDRMYGNMGVKLPKTIYRCMNNIFMDANYNQIENIDAYIKNISEDIIIKKSNSHGGIGIQKFNYSNGNLTNAYDGLSFNVHEFQNLFKGNFIVQEVVNQHSDLAKYHPNSLNTLKIICYRSIKDNKVHILLAHLRIGIKKSFVDNMTLGGLSVGLKINNKNEATLREYGFYEFGNSCKIHPDSNIRFKDNKISNFHLVFESIKKLSNVVPYQRLIGWDFSINEQEEPVLIEANYGSSIEVLQFSNGKPLFGRFTNEVKEYLDKC